jgi:hypothetical protein
MANEAYRYDAADLAGWLVTVFAPAVEGYWHEQLTLTGGCTDWSAYTPGASVIKVPLIPYLTAVTKTSGTPLSYEAESTDPSVGTINVTTHKALAFCVEDAVQMQVSVPLRESFIMMAGQSLAQALDTLIATTVQGETTNTAITTGTDNTITYQNLLTAQTTFNGQKIKIRNCSLGIAPGAFELSVADWGDKYTAAYHRGGGDTSMWLNGVEGKILGMQVFVDSNWTSGTTDECATIWHPLAMGYAHHGIKVKGPVQDALNIGDAFTVHMLMGAAVINAYGVLKIVND